MKWRRIKLTDVEIISLKKAEKNVKKPQLLKRIQCIKLKNKQWHHSDIADFLLVDVHTVMNWIKTYSEKGVEELLKWECVGRKSVLTEEQQKKLQKRNKEKPFDTAKEAKQYIKDNFSLDFHLHWVQKLLKKNFNCHISK